MGGKLTQKNGRRYAGGKPIPSSQFALPGQHYPIDTAGRARNALSRIAQYGTPEQKAKVRRAVSRRYKQIKVSGVQNHSNSYDFAGGNMHQLTHTHDGSTHTHDFSGDHRDGSLRTPAPSTGYAREGAPLSVRGASSPSTGLANGSGRAVDLARRLPVRDPMDIVISRQGDGSALIRHRAGGGVIGRMVPTDRGWSPEVAGRTLPPFTQQRRALTEMLGVYNRSAGEPLQPPAEQTPLMQQFGVPAIRLAYDPDDDHDNDGSVRDDTDKDYAGSLDAKGQRIYKKLKAKGMSDKVALAMAKRAQSFGSKAA